MKRVPSVHYRDGDDPALIRPAAPIWGRRRLFCLRRPVRDSRLCVTTIAVRNTFGGSVMSRLLRRLFARELHTPPTRRHVRRASDLRTRLLLQALEGRIAPATFTVSTAADSGAGSLRQAILDANAASGADT